MCIYNMEQMCTGVYYFLGPVFVMAEWECSLHPLSLPFFYCSCLPRQDRRDPVRTWVWPAVLPTLVPFQSLQSPSSPI